MANTITLYTRTTCPYCELVKKFLNAKEVTYNTVNMEENPDAMAKVMEMTGRSIAPTILVDKADGTQEIIVGFNLSKIAPAIA